MKAKVIIVLIVLIGFKQWSAAQVEQRETTGYRSSGYTTESEKDTARFDKWKGSFISVSAGLGSSSLNYKLNSLGEKGSRQTNLGYNFEIRYSYFFNPHWGVTTGIGISHYSNTGKLKGSLAEDKFYNLGMLVDNDWQEAPKDFELRTRVTNLKEKQLSCLLEVPLMLSYQTFFGDSAKWGIYGSLGAKLQFPVSTKFRIQSGAESEFNVSGQYDGIPTDMGSPENPPVPQHGYGTITNPNSTLSWDDKAKLKMGVAAAVELGFLISFSQDVSMSIGGYIDYGILNMKKNANQKLFAAPSAYHPGADNNIGNGITYNGMLNSDVTGKIKPVSFGGKVAFRFKTGRK